MGCEAGVGSPVHGRAPAHSFTGPAKPSQLGLAGLADLPPGGPARPGQPGLLGPVRGRLAQPKPFPFPFMFSVL